ncbi:MAG: D-alanyl-D-alanine carboxypeptidase/D-alanyl-D-alanine-endopeptidase [Bacteroidota bacterium]
MQTRSFVRLGTEAEATRHYLPDPFVRPLFPLLPMRRNLHLSRLLVLFVGVLAMTAPALAQSDAEVAALEDLIDAQLDAEAFDDAYWGAYVVDLTADRVLYDRNAARRFIPASNMKLFSTAALLDALGPDFKYTTRLYADGDVRDGTLLGSLVVRGSGDPTFGGRYTGGDLTRTFRQWADSLKAMGVRRITGDVIGDDDVFDDRALGDGWQWDDLVWYYGAEISGLQYNEGTINLAVHGTRPGERARIEVEPNVGYIQLANRTTTTDGGSIREGYSRDLSSNRFTVTVSVPAGRVEREAVAVSNPTAYFVRTLVAVLRREGIEVDGDAIDVDEWDGGTIDYEDLDRVATHRSPSLKNIIAETNTESNNVFSEHLLRTLGALRYTGDEHIPGSARSGVAAMEPFLNRIGVDPASLRIADGSGLSALNRLTPLATLRLLRAMHEHPNPAIAEAFYDSLPIGGRTGTLERRYGSGDARGNVRAKTGFISGARTLSGYVTAANGHLIAFSLMCNHYSVRTSRVNRAQDAVVELLADLGG